MMAHPNLANLRDFVEDREHIYIVMQLYQRDPRNPHNPAVAEMAGGLFLSFVFHMHD